MNKYLIEVGPSLQPSVNYINSVKPQRISFVAPEEPRFNHTHLFPDSEYFPIGFQQFVDEYGDDSIADHLLAINVLNSPRLGLDIFKLLNGAVNILKMGGILRIEHTTDDASIKIGERYLETCQSFGLHSLLTMAVDLNTVRQNFVQPNLWHKTVNDGFTILATKV